jgi:hypothetical protein
MGRMRKHRFTREWDVGTLANEKYSRRTIMSPMVVDQHGKAGRPTKYEPETVDRLLAGLADGLPISRHVSRQALAFPRWLIGASDTRS